MRYHICRIFGALIFRFANYHTIFAVNISTLPVPCVIKYNYLPAYARNVMIHTAFFKTQIFIDFSLLSRIYCVENKKARNF